MKALALFCYVVAIAAIVYASISGARWPVGFSAFIGAVGAIVFAAEMLADHDRHR